MQRSRRPQRSARPGWVHRVRRAVDSALHHGATELGLLLLIALSVALTVVEVVVRGEARFWVMRVGDVLTGIFAVELLLRFWIAPKKTRFFERYWIDILAVLPLVRPLRLFRVLRVLRLFRAGVLFRRRVAGYTFGGQGRGAEVMALFIGTVALVAISAVVLRVVEGETNPEFSRISDTFWFAAYSLVGGEPIGGSPQSYVGRWTTLILMLAGLTIFGVFVGAVSASMVTRLRGQLEVHELDIDELSGHVVVCGWNHSVRTVLRELFGPGTPADRCVVLVTEEPLPDLEIPFEDVRAEHLYRHIGDYTRESVLLQVGIPRAESVILMADALVRRSNQDCDARTVLAALTIERMSPRAYTVAELHSRQNEDLLRHSGVEDVVVADWYSGMILGSVQRNQGLVRVLDDILTQSHGSAFHTWELPEIWAGRTIADLHQVLYQEHRAILVGVEEEPGSARPVVNPPPETVLQPGQRVVVISPAAAKPL